MFSLQSPGSVRMIQCRVETIHDGGLVTLVGQGGERFNKISALKLGVDETPALGSNCLVLTDGAKFFTVRVEELDYDDDGNATTRNPAALIRDSNDVKSVVSYDGYGNAAGVYAGVDYGVVADGGGYCMTHWSPNSGRVTTYCEREETFMPGHIRIIDHNGELCGARYAWFGRIDPDSNQNELNYRDTRAERSDNMVHVDIVPSDTGLTVEVRNNSELRATISIDKEGVVNIVTSRNIVLQSDAAVQVISNNVNLGAEAGADHLALKGEVNAALAAIHNDLLSLQLALNSHTHLITPPGGPSGPALPQVVPPVGSPQTINGTSNVKAT